MWYTFVMEQKGAGMNKRAQAYKQKEHGTGGRFSTLNPCYGCGKSAGENYPSHDLTDQLSPLGEDWGDAALCICEKCADATGHMKEPAQFLEYAKANGGYGYTKEPR